MESWRRLDRAAPDEARALLFRCCGSTRWVEAMLARRPFGRLSALLDSAAAVWDGLAESDWREAFSHHPAIGDTAPDDVRFTGTRALSTREQAGVADAPAEVVHALAEGNRAYAARFGHIFIVCATGRTAESMLSMLQDRLTNDPATEIRIAAAEQAKITALRLRGL